jgi:hypothetical protein
MNLNNDFALPSNASTPFMPMVVENYVITRHQNIMKYAAI